MINVLSLFAFTFLSLPMSGFPIFAEWHGIVPLKSTRADVIRLLGAPDEPGGTFYILPNENVRVWYSVGSCERDPKGWNVEPNLVTEFTVYYKTKVSASTLNLAGARFKKFNDPEVQNLVYYKNEDEGMLIEVNDRLSTINSITFFPEAKDNRLRCAGATKKNASGGIANGVVGSQKFDEYVDKGPAKEKLRLIQFAREIKQRQRNEADTKGYVIAYAGRRSHVGEARVRAARAKLFLVSKRGLRARDIVAVDGGYREAPTIELWIRPNGGTVPTASPTLDPKEVKLIQN